jgi:hypothetical protein
MAGVDDALTGVDNSWGAARIINFVEGKLSLKDSDENGTGMRMPSG